MSGQGEDQPEGRVSIAGSSIKINTSPPLGGECFGRKPSGAATYADQAHNARVLGCL